MASSIPAAKAALLAALQASNDTAFHRVTFISSGDWSGRQPAEDLIVVEHSREIQREWAGLGTPHRLEETFVLTVSIEVRHRGNNVDAAEERMWDLVTAVEKTVLADVTLGGTVRQARPDGSPEGERVGPSDLGGVGAVIDLRLACQQRVQLA